MKTKPYLDKRHLGTSTDKTATIKIAINHGGSSGYVLTDVHVMPSEWDGARVVDNPRATALNVKIRNKWNDIELAIDELNREGKLKGMNASAIARAITHHLASSDAPADLFFPHFRDFVGRKKEERTVRTYKTTERKINAFGWVDI